MKPTLFCNRGEFVIFLHDRQSVLSMHGMFWLFIPLLILAKPVSPAHQSAGRSVILRFKVHHSEEVFLFSLMARFVEREL